MGFHQVFHSLQEVFPEIDARILRAVAVEHSRDADAAVEAVLVEIIPFISEISRPGTPLSGSTTSVGKPSQADVHSVATVETGVSVPAHFVDYTGEPNGLNLNRRGKKPALHAEPIYDTYHGPYEGERSVRQARVYQLNGKGVRKNADVLVRRRCEGIVINEDRAQKNADVHRRSEAVAFETIGLNTLQSEVRGDSKENETVSADKFPTLELETVQDEVLEIDPQMNPIKEKEDFDHLEVNFGGLAIKESDMGKSSPDNRDVEIASPIVDALTTDALTTGALENSSELVVVSEIDGSDEGKLELEVSLPTNTDPIVENSCNIVGTEDESTLSTSMSQSSQVQVMDALEEIITDARNNKKTMFSAMESVISLMREVELKEQAVEQAKVEAAVGGSDVLFKVEELKQFVQSAKDANGMHAGEVYGEKAILATELRELQSRVLSLSDERDKSLSVLDEMRRTLEVRLAAAENEIKSAEEEKLEKEKAAMEAFTEQKLIMEKVVEESKILKQQAEDNAMLQEFLMDRGRVVDMLQGEIAVICHDVRLLKEKFEERVPYSKSLASSQTSCILASSTSSVKSQNPEQVEPLHNESSLETKKKTESISGFEDGHSSSSEDEAAATYDDLKALAADNDDDDDGWELFDINREIYE
ncbi:hypothetical protein ABFS83_14G198200 [Erythranthe nasuta]